jgi:hypothetical protein
VPLYVLDVDGPGFLRFGPRAGGGIIVHAIEAIEFTERSGEGGYGMDSLDYGQRVTSLSSSDWRNSEKLS